MRFVRFAANGGPLWGVQQADGIVPLSGLREEVSYRQLADDGFLDLVEGKLDVAADHAVSRDKARILAPVPQPGKIVCVGLNYHDHAEEQDEDVPDTPLLFGKAPSAVTNPESPIIHPADLEQVDYEVELGVVVGRTARNVDTEKAHEVVAGYTAINDVSGRDAQVEDGQFLRGKSYDTFCPMGPALVPDRYVDPTGLDVACRVNGDTKQSSNTDQFIFGVDELVEYISSAMTLHPGDIVSTGTPGGVGVFRDPPELLDPGDDVEIEIEGIGTLHNPVVAE